MEVRIRPAETADADGIWSVLSPMLSAGDTYTLPSNLEREAALAYWMSPSHSVFVAVAEQGVVGTFYIRANQQGGGGHVANCGYVVGRDAQGRGIARAMCLHSLQIARAHGYRAMQFNFVVSTNTRAIALWQDLGFDIVGTLPGAFLHPTHGYVDAHVMYRSL